MNGATNLVGDAGEGDVLLDHGHGEQLREGQLERVVDAAVHPETPSVGIDLRNVEGGVDPVESAFGVTTGADPRDGQARTGGERGRGRHGRGSSTLARAAATLTRSRSSLPMSPETSAAAARPPLRKRNRRRVLAGAGQCRSRWPAPPAAASSTRNDTMPAPAAHVAADERSDERRSRHIERGRETEHGEHHEDRLAGDTAPEGDDAGVRTDEETQHDRARDQRRLVAGAEAVDAETHQGTGRTVDHLLRDCGDQRRAPLPEPGDQLGGAEREARADRAGDRGLGDPRLQTRIRSSGGRTPMTAKVRPIPRNMPQQIVRSAISSSAKAPRNRAQNSSPIARWSIANRSANSAASRSLSVSASLVRQLAISA